MFQSTINTSHNITYHVATVVDNGKGEVVQLLHPSSRVVVDLPQPTRGIQPLFFAMPIHAIQAKFLADHVRGHVPVSVVHENGDTLIEEFSDVRRHG